MSQNVTCPVCGDWEVIKSGPRKKSWRCSRCGAKAAYIATVVCRFGNHYLTSRIDEEVVFGTDNHLLARHYKFDEIEKLRVQHWKANRVFDLYTMDAILKIEADRQIASHRRAYFCVFEDEVGRLAKLDNKPLGPTWTYHIKGVGCASTAFGADEGRSDGLDPYTAAEVWYKKNPPRKAKKVV